jgi:hypothetical protein
MNSVVENLAVGLVLASAAAFLGRRFFSRAQGPACASCPKPDAGGGRSYRMTPLIRLGKQPMENEGPR